MNVAETRPAPWRPLDLLLLYVTTFFGVFLVFLAWYGASGAARLNSQVRWTNVGVVGVIVLGAGNLWWLLRGRRATTQLRRVVLPLVPVGARASGAAAPSELVAGSGMTRYHRGDCLMVEGKTVHATTEAAHRRAGRQPCQACQPEQT